MKRPVVSVIIPNYNHGLYLSSRIDSILRQSYQDFELILLDDCSSDNSRDILYSYQSNPYVAHITFNEENGGNVFRQWDKGLRLARGKYVWIAESDDYADSDFLMKTVDALEQNPDVVLAFTGSQMIDSEGRNLLLDWDKFAQNVSLLTKFESSYFLSKKMLWNNSIYNASMVLFRKECYDKADFEYRQFRYCGDWLFWIRVCQQGNVISINRKLNYFRQHENKVSPHAEKEGLYFMEGSRVMQYMISLLHLSLYQRLVVTGRIWRHLLRISNGKGELKRKVLMAHPSLFKNKRLSVMVYEFDKLFNISGLQR